MRLLHRYVLLQLVGPFIFAVSALTSIMLLNQVARRFGALVGKGLPWSVIAEVFWLSVPFIVAMTLPMAVLVAVLYAFSHLAADNEITTMRASGVSLAQSVRPVLLVGLLMSGVNFLFVDQVLPKTNARLRTLLVEIGRKKPTLDLREQVINEIPPSQLFLRAGRIEAGSGRLRDVSIYDMGGGDERRVIYADSGRMAFEEGQRDLTFRLYDGAIHQYKNSDPHVFQLTYFGANAIRVENVANQLERGVTEIARGDREMSTCEMAEVVRISREDVRRAEALRERLLLRDLRGLAGLSSAVPPDTLTPITPGPYCHWWQRLGHWLSPETAEAQAPAQAPKPKPPGPFDPKTRFLGSLGDEATGPARAALTPRPTITNWAEVSSAIEQSRSQTRHGNRYAVEVHKKWAISVACLVFVIVGIPMALRFPRGGMGLVIGGGLFVFAIYYVGLTAGESLGDLGYITPAVAMWLPNVVLTGLGLIGHQVVSRESGSTRGGDLAELWDTIRRPFRRRPA